MTAMMRTEMPVSYCRLGRCGDGIRHGVLGEECDDGNRNDSDDAHQSVKMLDVVTV